MPRGVEPAVHAYGDELKKLESQLEKWKKKSPKTDQDYRDLAEQNIRVTKVFEEVAMRAGIR